ncbi:MAG: PBSX family phage terminase large subunit, partial [Coprobacillus sp.]
MTIFQEVKTIELSKLIAPAFYDIHWDIKEGKHTHYDLSGGRGSTKSSFISVEIPLGMMQDSNANAVVYRKVGDTLRDSVYEQILWGIEALGVSHLWHPSLTPLTITYLPTGQKILFRGLDKAEKSKSIKIKKGYFKYLWFEELDEFNGMEEIRKVEQSVMRGGAKFIVFRSYNPPKSINNWVNQEALVIRDDALKHHSTYLEVPAEWLGQTFIDEAEQLKKTNNRAYRHEYLGIATGTGGQVFDNVTVRKISDDEVAMFDKLRNGLDFGFAKDPLAYVKMHFNKKQMRLFIFGEIYAVKMSTDKAVTEIKKLNPLNKLITADS